MLCTSESLICNSSHHSDSVLGFVDPHGFSLSGFPRKILLFPCFLYYVCISVILDLCTRIHTRVKRLWPVMILTRSSNTMTKDEDEDNTIPKQNTTRLLLLGSTLEKQMMYT